MQLPRKSRRYCKAIFSVFRPAVERINGLAACGFLFFLVNVTANAQIHGATQPSTTIDKKGKFIVIADSKMVYTSSLDSANIPPSNLTQSSVSGSVVHDVIFNDKKIKQMLVPVNCTEKAPFGLEITHCHFRNGKVLDYSNEDCENNIPYINFAREVEIDECFFDKELPVNSFVSSSFAAQLNVRNDTANYFDLRHSNIRLVTVNGNFFSNALMVSYTHFGTAIFASNVSLNPFSYFSSSFSIYKTGIELVNNGLKYSAFSVDTLGGLLRYVADIKMKGKDKNLARYLNFSGCYINATVRINISDSLYRSKVVFDDCSFGPLASIFGINADTVEFRNCPNIPYPLFLTVDPAKTKVVYLELINSNVANIRFDYTEKFKLYFDNDISEETKNNTYQSLLGKYKAEGKPENIEKIDIEYKRYLYRQHYYSYPLWLLDYIWWRYTYSKWLVVIWCIVFLTAFFIYNWRNWDRMQMLYSIYSSEKSGSKTKKVQHTLLPRKLVYVFVFTSFIFFSLRVDFDKLKYSDRKFLFVFFIQYLVGLVCLFFLANAIFKI